MAKRSTKSQEEKAPPKQLTEEEIAKLSDEERAAYVESILGGDDESAVAEVTEQDAPDDAPEGSAADSEASSDETSEETQVEAAAELSDEEQPAAGAFGGEDKVTGEKPKKEETRPRYPPPQDPPGVLVGKHLAIAYKRSPERKTQKQNPQPSQEHDDRFYKEKGFWVIVDSQGEELLVVPELAEEIAQWLDGRLVGGFDIRNGEVFLVTESDGQKSRFYMTLDKVTRSVI